MLYLIVSIPDLCLLPYLDWRFGRIVQARIKLCSSIRTFFTSVFTVATVFPRYIHVYILNKYITNKILTFDTINYIKYALLDFFGRLVEIVSD